MRARALIERCRPDRYVFPRVCERCETPLDEAVHRKTPFLCGPCGEALLPIDGPACPVCGQSFEGVAPGGWQCSNCRGRDLGFDFAVGAYRSEGTMRELMHAYKYRGRIHLARLFGAALARTWSDPRLSRHSWVLVPVPLSAARYRRRRSNQALEMARVFRRRLPDPKAVVILPLLRRIRHTPRQASLDRGERLSNLAGAFRVARRFRNREELEGARFLLVDDVLTTGSTVSECGFVLREAFGPEAVAAITVLRG